MPFIACKHPPFLIFGGQSGGLFFCGFILSNVETVTYGIKNAAILALIDKVCCKQNGINSANEWRKQGEDMGDI